MSDAYAYAAKGKLKLKCDSELKKKKKKKHKSKDKEKEELQQAYVEQQINEGANGTVQASTSNSSGYQRKLTKAELATKKQQEKMRNKRIMDKAQTTHKQRVEKFNEHLDTLTEHFDIPKVSWTK